MCSDDKVLNIFRHMIHVKDKQLNIFGTSSVTLIPKTVQFVIKSHCYCTVQLARIIQLCETLKHKQTEQESLNYIETD